MNIGSSNIVLTDLNGRSGTAAIACHLDTDTNSVTGEIRFGSYKSDTESLGVLSDIVEKLGNEILNLLHTKKMEKE